MPLVIVPSDVMFPCTVAGNVFAMDGTPVAPVIKTPLLAVARPLKTLLADEYNIWLIVVVDG